MSQLIVEGSWEEVARRADEFAGRRVRLIVLDERLPEPERTLAEALQGIAGAIDSTEDSPDRHPPTPFTDALADKFRKQGLIIP
jgi:hypothetical protein